MKFLSVFLQSYKHKYTARTNKWVKNNQLYTQRLDFVKTQDKSYVIKTTFIDSKWHDSKSINHINY